LLRITNLLWFPRRNQLMKKGLMVEPSITPMNGSMVQLQKVILKYHRVLQT
jgi:hypothetical protein